MAKKKKLKNFKVIKAARGRDAGMGMAGKTGDFGEDKNTGGRDPSKQYTTKTKLSVSDRERLNAQKNRARSAISPSTTVGGKIAQGLALATLGVPTSLTAKAIDYSPMAFGVPKSTTPKQKKTIDKSPKNIVNVKDPNGGEFKQETVQPVIAGPIPINQPKPRIRPTVSPTGVFNYGFKKGGLLRQGKPKIAKKGWK